MPLRLLLALVLAAPAASAQAFFDAPYRTFETGTYENGQYPVTLTTGDLDGDGLPDAIVGQNIADGGIQVLFNQGNAGDAPATFGAPVFYPTSRGAWQVVARDLDGDGDVDLAATNTDVNYDGTSIVVLLNDGTGALSAPQAYPAGGPSTGLAAADLDGDGDLDLAVANYGFFGSGSTATVLLNDGNGAFSAHASYAVGTDPYRVQAGDLDGDGDLDLAVARSDNGVSLLFNDGSGAFGPAVRYDDLHPVAGTTDTADLAVLDADGDGDLDLAYTASTLFGTDGALFILLRNGGAGAMTPEAVLYATAGLGPTIDLTATDLNGDGAPDLVGAQLFGFGYSVILSDGSGGFLPAQVYASVTQGGESSDVAAAATADLDGDGAPDVLSVARIRRLLSVHENLGDGTFPQRPVYAADVGHGALETGDVDNDGDLDVVSSGGFGRATVEVQLNDGTGAFARSHRTADADFGYPSFRDFDGDGTLDLLFSELRPPYGAFTARGNGDGTFQPEVRWTTGACILGHVQGIDLDGDGDLDIVAPESGGCGPVPSGRLIALTNLGDGTFSGPADILEGTRPFNTAAGDIDEDGHLDLVTAGISQSVLALGNGDGTFQTPIVLSGPAAQNVLVLDLDDDGHLDVVKMDPYLPTGTSTGELMVSVLLGDGAGGFAETTYPEALSQGVLVWITAGDLDGDGLPDLAVRGAQDAVALRNDGAGGLAPAGRYGLGRGGFSPRLADVTGDGRPDLVALVSVGTAVVPSQGVTVLPGLAGSATSSPDDPLAGLAEGPAPRLSAPVPNPAARTAAFTLDVPTDQHVVADVIDALGRRVRVAFDGPVRSGEATSLTLDVSSLVSGTYAVRARGSAGSTTTFFTVSR